jgi:hypothetical protein
MSSKAKHQEDQAYHLNVKILERYLANVPKKRETRRQTGVPGAKTPKAHVKMSGDI